MQTVRRRPTRDAHAHPLPPLLVLFLPPRLDDACTPAGCTSFLLQLLRRSARPPLRQRNALQLCARMSRAADDVGGLVLQLTASGERAELASAPLKELSRLCATDKTDSALRGAFSALQRRLRAPDSRVRLRATLLADHFFRRSKLFRELLTRWLADYLACVGLSGAPPPPPQPTASRLQALALKQLEAWVEGWGAHYAELHVALRHAADRAEAAPRALPGSAEAAQARRAARARELARQRYFSFRPSVEPLFVAVRSVLAQLDAAVSLSCAADAPKESGDADNWEDVPTALPLVAGGAQAAAEAQDAAVQEALRGVLRDLEARQEELKAAIAELSNTAVDDTQRVPLLQEALALKTALAVAHKRGAAYV